MAKTIGKSFDAASAFAAFFRRRGGKRAALAAILMAIALGFGGALTDLQPTEARADAEPIPSAAALTGAQPSVALSDALPGEGAGAGGAQAHLAPTDALPGVGAGGAAAAGRAGMPGGGAGPVAPAAQSNVDYDDDDDNLIDVRTLGQLNAIRYDLDGNGSAANVNYNASGAFENAASGMGCASTCAGYELRKNLNFDTNDDGSVTSADTYSNWSPIGDGTAGAYTGEFKGNGHTIANLTMSAAASTHVGLFGNLSGTVTGVGLVSASVTSSVASAGFVGTLAGLHTGTIRESWASNSSITSSGVGESDFGGLVGRSTGTIASSWANASINAAGASANLGGLVGYMAGASANVTACFANVGLNATGANGKAGGLIGEAAAGSTVTASYANGLVAAGGSMGVPAGLIAESASGITVTASYWDITGTSIADDADGDAPEGITRANMRSPTGYTGIYAAWNVNVDGVAGNDDPWDFGTGSEHPALKVGEQIPYIQRGDYDDDDDGLIDVRSLVQLDAVRHDLNGDGSVAGAGPSNKYTTAFPNRNQLAASRMGCPETSATPDNIADCIGYELRNNLDFDTDGSGSVDTNDDYPNFAPIGSSTAYTAQFKGNNRTISNLTMSVTSIYAGLFGNVSGTVTGVGLPDASVSHAASSGTNVRAGALVGLLGEGTVRSSWSTGSVSSSSARANTYVGGLVGGIIDGTLTSSWSGADASVSNGTTTSSVGGLVGALQNFSASTTASIIASYATGSASNTATSGTRNTGGLVGAIDSSSGGSYALTASYTAATVSSAATAQAIIGVIASSSTGTITASYWDISKTGIEDDSDSNAPEGKTASELTTPTAYGTQSTDIYMGWNVNVDGAAGNDDPWNFGNANQYPKLKFDGMSLSAQTIAPPTDYDTDDDGLIDIRNLAQLNAVRHDPDADGEPVGAGAATYAAAFPNRDLSAGDKMGCADTSDPADGTADCAGYELMADLDFDTDGDGDIDADDTPSYPNWSPIGMSSSTAYRAEFKGNNRTISNLTMTGYTTVRYYGLFGRLRQGAAISGLGMKDVNIDLATLPSSGTNYIGSIAGYTEDATVRSSYSTGLVKIAPPATALSIGGLVGYMVNGGFFASWSSADVVITAAGADAEAGGLAGTFGSDGAGNVAKMIASYATGAVSNSATTGVNFAGGLAGSASATTGATSWEITASYAAGPVSATGTAGGVVANVGSGANITDTFWDTNMTGIADDADGNAPEGRTLRQLQQPRPYSGIYRDWNVDVDEDNDNDDPWAFGTAMQYPMLKYGGMSLPAQGGLAMGAADVDRNGIAPTVGRMARVCLTTGPVLRERGTGGQRHQPWRWSRSTDGVTWTSISEDGGGTYEYTPVAADVNNYLRACVAIRSSDARSGGESMMCTRPFPPVEGN